MHTGKKHFYLKRKNMRKSHKKYQRKQKQKGGEAWYNPAKGPAGFAWEGGNIVSWPGVYAANSGNTDGITMSNFIPQSETGIGVGGKDPLPLKENNFPYNPPPHYTEAAYKNLKGGGRKSIKNKSKKLRKSRKMRGGFFGLGQNLINLGRDIKFRANSFYNDLMGVRPPTNPSPLDQPINQDLKILNIKPINLPKSYKEAGSKVVSI